MGFKVLWGLGLGQFGRLKGVQEFVALWYQNL